MNITPYKLIKKIFKVSYISKFILYLRIKKINFFGMEKEFHNMEHNEIFDKIYSDKIWGVSSDGNANSGVGSHLPYIIEPYIRVVKLFLSKVKPSVVVDLGCGDFNVGKNFTTYTKKYLACDVSPLIIDHNKSKYKNFDNVEFLNIDICKDKLPKGEIAFVRQVLQHLSNKAIENFVNYINECKPFKYLLVTEHLSTSNLMIPNINKPSGSRIRTRFNSGIILHKKPFLISCKSYEVLLDIPVSLKYPLSSRNKDPDSKIITILYSF